MAGRRVLYFSILLISLVLMRHFLWKMKIHTKTKAKTQNHIQSTTMQKHNKIPQKHIPHSEIQSTPRARVHNTTTTLVQSTTPSPPAHTACWKTNVTSKECKRLNVEEDEETLMFPPQIVAGAPGSGNDWILWLASLSGYTENIFGMRQRCSIYLGNTLWTQNLTDTNDCLFIKSHEPWMLQIRSAEHSVRAALLLRHPYDVAIADYKRELVSRYEGDTLNVKRSVVGLRIEKFIDMEYKTVYRGLQGALRKTQKKWLTHAEYWLTRYPKPLHILLYNSVRNNTAVEIEAMQRFFGYNFTGVNFRRHCCVMAHPNNPALKRAPSVVDRYKDYIYDNNLDIRKMMENAVGRVHGLLDKKFPDKQYRIARG